MFPTLLQLGPIAITSLGFFLFLAFLAGAFFIWQKGKEENFDPEPLMDSVILTSIIAFWGARLAFFIFSPEKSLGRFFNFFRYPGFSFFGGLIAGLLFLVYFAHRKKWNLFKLLDVYVFGIIPGQIFLRFGNFLDGSFYGKETSLPWGIIFPGLESPVHPLNLYEFFFLIGLFYLIKRLERQYRLFEWYKNKRGVAAPGFLFLVYLLFYSVFRFLLEFLKDSALYWRGLGWEQWLAAVLAVASLLLFYGRSGRTLKDIIVIFKVGIIKLVSKRAEEKLEVLVPVDKERKTPIAKKEFHIKAGVDAKEKK